MDSKATHHFSLKFDNLTNLFVFICDERQTCLAHSSYLFSSFFNIFELFFRINTRYNPFLKEFLENRTSKNNLKIIFNLYQIEFHMKLALKK